MQTFGKQIWGESCEVGRGWVGVGVGVEGVGVGREDIMMNGNGVWRMKLGNCRNSNDSYALRLRWRLRRRPRMIQT